MAKKVFHTNNETKYNRFITLMPLFLLKIILISVSILVFYVFVKFSSAEILYRKVEFMGHVHISCVLAQTVYGLEYIHYSVFRYRGIEAFMRNLCDVSGWPPTWSLHSMGIRPHGIGGRLKCRGRYCISALLENKDL